MGSTLLATDAHIRTRDTDVPVGDARPPIGKVQDEGNRTPRSADRVLDDVSRYIADFSLSDVPEDVRAHARLTILDSLGVMIRGARTPHISALAQLYQRRGSHGNSLSLCDGKRRDAADAAMLNALAACAQVLDEGHKYARGHVATYILPSVLAAAQEQNSSGDAFLAAFIIGYEVAARLGIGGMVRPGMHPSGTWGSIAASAAVGTLMGFDPVRIRAAMNMTAPLMLTTSWKAAEEGATVRDLYSGRGAENAVWAPRWVDAGFTASTNDVEHVLSLIGADKFNSQALTHGLGEHWEIQRNYFKTHACCRNFQSAIDAAISLKAGMDINLASVERITVDTFAIPVRDNVHIQDSNVLAARESLPVSLALTLVYGHCDNTVFQMDRLKNPEVTRLSTLVDVVSDPELDRLFPEKRPSRLTLYFKDGRTASEYAELPLGDPDRPMSTTAIHDKFYAAAPDTSREMIGRVKTIIDQLEQQSTLEPLTDALAGVLHEN